MARIQTLKLGYERNITPIGPQSWHVLVVKNSTAFTPGDALCKGEVDELCASPRWDVTIVKYQPEAKR